MRGDRFSLLAGLVVIALLLLAGCSNEAPTTPAAPAPTAVSPSPTASPEPTEPADEYAIPDDPDDIDEAYVERVLEALSESTAAAAREVARKGRMTRRAKTLLASSYRAGESLDGVVAAFRRAAREEPAGEVFNRDASGIPMDVQELIGVSTSCVFAAALQDTSDLAGQEIEPFVGYFHIETKTPQEDPENLNPTPWMIVAEVGEPPPGQEYENPCE